MGQTLNLKGRVLDKANMLGVPGATVKAGAAIATTDSAGRFTLTGSVGIFKGGLDRSPAEPYFRGNDLFVQALDAGQSARVELFGAKGESLSSSLHALKPGWNKIDAAGKTKGGNYLGFARITVGKDAWVKRMLHTEGPVPASLMGGNAPVTPAGSAHAFAKVAAGQVDVSADKLVSKSVPYTSDSQDLGDIVLDYPARKLGVGAAPPYGAVFLFDGSHGPSAAKAEMLAKWKHWPRYATSNLASHQGVTPYFNIATDPQFKNDTTHATMQTCCPTASSWGYDDIQAIATHGDVQLHVEWNSMGLYDNGNTAGENADSSSNCSESTRAPCFFNSGVYVQSRYEIQLQAFPTGVDIATKGTSHSLGSIVNEFTPTSNQFKGNGLWNSYDVTFRTARYKPGNHSGSGDTLGIMTIWWNGVQTHLNRRVTGVASGLGNHSGEEMNDTLYGLKLQNETGDIRYRNIWMKTLHIDSTGTNFGY